MKLSGLQKEVLSLYRKILREAARKDRAAASVASGGPSFTDLLKGGGGSVEARSSISKPTSISYAASEFRKQASTAKRSDFKKIEYMIRKGEKQLKLLQMPGVVKVDGR